MKSFLLATLLLTAQATSFRRKLISSNHKHAKFLRAGKNHAPNKFHAVIEILKGSVVTGTSYKNCVDSSGDNSVSCVNPVDIETDSVIVSCAEATAAAPTKTCQVTATKNAGGYNHVQSKITITLSDGSTTVNLIEETYLCRPGSAPTSGTCSVCSESFATLGVNSCTAWSNCAIGMGMTIAGTSATDRVCGDCDVGMSYSTTNDNAVCTACDLNAGGCGGGSAGTCKAGYTGDGVTCSPCDSNTYKATAGNDVSCTACDLNAGGCGVTPYDTAGTCKAGYTDIDPDPMGDGTSSAGATCYACAPGKYKATAGNDVLCTACDGGTSSDAAATSCIATSVIYGNIYQCDAGPNQCSAADASSTLCSSVCGDVSGVSGPEVPNIDVSVGSCSTDVGTAVGDIAYIYSTECKVEWDAL